MKGLYVRNQIFNQRLNYYIIHAFITRTKSVMTLNQRCWQSLGGQHGSGVDGLLEKASFQTAFEGVESG